MTGVQTCALPIYRVVDAAPVVAAMRLHDENVAPANAFTKPNAHFAVRELDETRVTKFDIEMIGHFLRQIRMRAPRIERHPLGSDLLHRAPAVRTVWVLGVHSTGAV